MTEEIIIAGFGGQGVLSMGKILAYAGLMEGKEVTWMPAYGPEQRGGTANVTVIVSDDPVSSPILSSYDTAIVLNQPSLEKFEPKVKPGGTIFVDSSLIERKVERDDVNVYYVPATKLAGENGAPTLANMILVGKLLDVFGEYDAENVRTALGKCVSARHADLFELNLKAMEIGRDS